MYVNTMRIACVFVPHLPLQAVVRRRPALRKHAVAIVSGGPSASVVACSRQAFAAGVRVGMPAYVVRQSCAESAPELVIESQDLEAELQLSCALAESLYGISGCVEAEHLRREGRALGESQGAKPGTFLAEVPNKMRGATFGGRALELAAALDIAVRVGIADDRFTAWVAARHAGQVDEPVLAIPRGGSAAFLAPQPLSLLDISLEVQQMLAALGVRTLGEFAGLPAPSVARRWDLDFQALARGEGGSKLTPIVPQRLVLREDVEVCGELGLGEAVSILAERISLRLSGRAAVATALEVSAQTAQGLESTALGLVPPLADAQALADLLGRAVGGSAVQRLAVVVTAAQQATAQVDEQGAQPEAGGAALFVLAGSAGSSGPAGPGVGVGEPVVMQASTLGAARSQAPRTGQAIGMSGALLRRLEPEGSSPPHRRTRRGKQRRRIASTQARLFGND
jgi:nucleotidyltransferase/DNA polymerase involved in DNA repair